MAGGGRRMEEERGRRTACLCRLSLVAGLRHSYLTILLRRTIPREPLKLGCAKYELYVSIGRRETEACADLGQNRCSASSPSD